MTLVEERTPDRRLMQWSHETLSFLSWTPGRRSSRNFNSGFLRDWALSDPEDIRLGGAAKGVPSGNKLVTTTAPHRLKTIYEAFFSLSLRTKQLDGSGYTVKYQSVTALARAREWPTWLCRQGREPYSGDMENSGCCFEGCLKEH